MFPQTGYVRTVGAIALEKILTKGIIMANENVVHRENDGAHLSVKCKRKLAWLLKSIGATRKEIWKEARMYGAKKPIAIDEQSADTLKKRLFREEGRRYVAN